MPAELMVINPVRRRRKMSAKQRKYFGPKRRKSKRSYARRNPVATVSSYAAPKRRRRSSSRRRISRGRAYYRRARSSGGFKGIAASLIPAGIGAGGAFLLDMAWANLPIPDMLKQGYAAPITRLGLAVGVGVVVGMVAGKRYGAEATAGALVVTLYDLIKAQVAPSVPATPSAVNGFVRGLGYNSAARQAGLGMFTDSYDYA